MGQTSSSRLRVQSWWTRGGGVDAEAEQEQEQEQEQKQRQRQSQSSQTLNKEGEIESRRRTGRI